MSNETTKARQVLQRRHDRMVAAIEAACARFEAGTGLEVREIRHPREAERYRDTMSTGIQVIARVPVLVAK